MYKGPARKFKKRGKFAKRLTQYGQQLVEKQKLRMLYGVREQTMKNYYLKAQKQPTNNDLALLQFLEQRLDNIVYRAGFATTRSQARQIVNHGHILLNEKRVNIPSCHIKKGDVVGIRPLSRTRGMFKDLSITLTKHAAPVWLKMDLAKTTAQMVDLPGRESIQEPVDASLVVEFYSR